MMMILLFNDKDDFIAEAWVWVTTLTPFVTDRVLYAIYDDGDDHDDYENAMIMMNEAFRKVTIFPKRG